MLELLVVSYKSVRSWNPHEILFSLLALSHYLLVVEFAYVDVVFALSWVWVGHDTHGFNFYNCGFNLGGGKCTRSTVAMAYLLSTSSSRKERETPWTSASSRYVGLLLGLAYLRVHLNLPITSSSRMKQVPNQLLQFCDMSTESS